MLTQGRQKLFITGQAKLNPDDYSIKCVGGRYTSWYTLEVSFSTYYL